MNMDGSYKSTARTTERKASPSRPISCIVVLVSVAKEEGKRACVQYEVFL